VPVVAAALLAGDVGVLPGPSDGVKRNAALMVNHGVVSCGSDVVTGVMTAVLLGACLPHEHACAFGRRSEDLVER
jgi:hypothetical protein